MNFGKKKRNTNTPWVKSSNKSFLQVVLVEGGVTFVVFGLLFLLLLWAISITDWVNITEGVSIGDLLTAFSIFSGIVIGLAGYVNSKDTSRRSHTISLLSQMNFNDSLHESSRKVRRMDGEKAAREFENGNLCDGDKDHLVRVLNFHEFVSNSCEMGDVNRQVVFKLRGDIMSDTYHKFEDLIKLVREKRSSESLKAYQNLVEEYDDLKYRYKKQELEEAHRKEIERLKEEQRREKKGRTEDHKKEGKYIEDEYNKEREELERKHEREKKDLEEKYKKETQDLENDG